MVVQVQEGSRKAANKELGDSRPGGKSFADDTISRGISGAVYLIQDNRRTVSGGTSEPVGIQFGVGGGW